VVVVATITVSWKPGEVTIPAVAKSALASEATEDAIASAVHTARALTQAATGENRLAATRV
jgi:hypothetical protein